MPTTVIDVLNLDSHPSPLKRYRIKQQPVIPESNNNGGVQMLSPKEPRTLGSLMQASLPPDITDNACNTQMVGPIKKRIINFSQTDADVQEEGAAPQSQFFKETTGTTVQIPASSLVERILPNSHEQNELQRSVSLIERTSYSDCNADENYGVEQVQISVKQEPGGSGEYAPATPPQRKKVCIRCLI